MLSAKASTRSPISCDWRAYPFRRSNGPWQNLAKRRIYSVPRVALTPAQIDALGL